MSKGMSAEEKNFCLVEVSIHAEHSHISLRRKAENLCGSPSMKTPTSFPDEGVGVRDAFPGFDILALLA